MSTSKAVPGFQLSAFIPKTICVLAASFISIRGSAVLFLESNSNNLPSSAGCFNESAIFILKVCALQSTLIKNKSKKHIFFMADILLPKYT
jgi:hypothetical protein